MERRASGARATHLPLESRLANGRRAGQTAACGSNASWSPSRVPLRGPDLAGEEVPDRAWRAQLPLLGDGFQQAIAPRRPAQEEARHLEREAARSRGEAQHLEGAGLLGGTAERLQPQSGLGDAGA